MRERGEITVATRRDERRLLDDGARVIVGGEDDHAVIYDVETMKYINSIDVRGPVRDERLEGD